MNIFFSLDKGEIWEIVPEYLPEKFQYILIKLHAFASGRYMPLKENINQEESKLHCFTVFNLDTVLSQFGIGYEGYSTTLKDKMKASLTDEDLNFFFGQVLNDV